MLKLVSWNIARSREPWRVLIDADADIALLQEATPPPADIASRFDVGAEPWQTEGTGVIYRYRTALVPLNRRLNVTRIATAPLTSAEPTQLPVSRVGTVAAAKIEDPVSGEQFTVLSIYGFWESPRTWAGQWIYADATAHRLISDLAALVGTQLGHRMLVGGDLNILRGYGENRSPYWAARYRTVFDRFDAVGLPCVGPQSPNGRQAHPWPSELPAGSLNVPTYRRGASPESATRQLDFVFASSAIASHVKTRAVNGTDDWGPSDHCQVRIEVE
jgi:endonuclease/exonuclease/phosphatase family metal-dependent hydrolase